MEHPVYFDNGATSFPKPSCMYRTLYHAMHYHGGNPHRSGHRLSIAASHDMFRFREKAAEFFSISKPEHVIGVYNATMGLNIAIKGCIGAGDTVYISEMEHNAVLRPLKRLEQDKGINIKTFKCYKNDKQTTEELFSMCKLKKPTAIICLHASNICQIRLPIKEIGEYCRKNGIIFIVDGAQSGGHLKIDFDAWGIDALCLAGHKGLMGPMGTGALLISQHFADIIQSSPTLFEGGSGAESASPFMPSAFPERLEAGTVPSYLYAALTASIEHLQKTGFSAIAQHEKKLYCSLMDILTSNKRVKVYLPEYTDGSVISFNIDGLTPGETADLLDRKGICIRSGLHCAPLAHKSLGTYLTGGTARISLGYYNTISDVRYFHKAIKEITG